MFPFAAAYDGVTRLRNGLYDAGHWKSARFDRPVVCVGNLTVGGTGKTPMVEYLLRLLEGHAQAATLSRGYGRKTKGYRLASQADTPETLGDEPMQLFRKFGASVPVSVGERRAEAIPCLLADRPEVEAILLDDAFQHRQVSAGLNVLLSDYNRPFYEDSLLPMGRLRESRRGARRADLIVVTKCPPDMPESERQAIEAKVHPYSRHDVPTFFATLRYGAPAPLNEAARKQLADSLAALGRATLVTGLAKAGPLRQHVESQCLLVKHHDRPDHHAYTSRELLKYADEARASEAALLTTEKDAVKWAAYDSAFADVPAYALPVETAFLEKGEVFDERVLSFVRRSA